MTNRTLFCFIPVLIMTGLLSSCSASGVRPQDANLFEAIGNHNSGEFQRQTRRKVLSLNDSKRKTVKQRKSTDGLQAQLTRSREEKILLVGSLNTLRGSNQLLEKQILAIKVKNRAELSRKDRLVDKAFLLNKKINALKKEIASKSESTIPSAEYEKKIKVLKSQVRTLRKLVLAQ